MVKKLDETKMNEYMDKYINGRDREKLWISLNMGDTNIQKWIEGGMFTHLKKELQIYHNVEFGCLKQENSCHYLFFSKNGEAIDRISNFFNTLIDGFKIPLIKCSTKKLHSSHEDNKLPINGQYNVCPLF